MSTCQLCTTRYYCKAAQLCNLSGQRLTVEEELAVLPGFHARGALEKQVAEALTELQAAIRELQLVKERQASAERRAREWEWLAGLLLDLLKLEAPNRARTRGAERIYRRTAVEFDAAGAGTGQKSSSSADEPANTLPEC